MRYLIAFQNMDTVKIVFDICLCGELLSTGGNNRLFQQRADGFAPVGSCRRLCGDLSRVRGIIL